MQLDKPAKDVHVIIKREFFENDDYPVWFDYFSNYGFKFETYDEYRNFFLEVANNNPEGVNLSYLEHLIYYYTTGRKTRRLIELGVLKESYKSDGTPYYEVVVKK